MWNLTYSNQKCYEIEKIREHRLHLERIVTMKKGIDIKEPHKPSFLVFKAKKEIMEEGNYFKILFYIEKNSKINYENQILLKRIIEIENKPSTYHPVNVQVKECPAFDKNFYVNKRKKYNLEQDNMVSYINFLIL
jgi:hypothetical protein